MRYIDVRNGRARVNGNVLIPVAAGVLKKAGVVMAMFPGEGRPWIEREPFRGRETPADLLAVAEELIDEAQAEADAPPPPPTLDEARAAKRREIERAHRQAVSAALGATPHAPGLAGDAAYVDARLAAEGGQDRAALVQRLRAEADAARSAAGAADGKRAKLLAALDAAESVDAVEALAW